MLPDAASARPVIGVCIAHDYCAVVTARRYNAMLARYMLWPCLSVRPPQVGVLSKQLNIIKQTTTPYDSPLYDMYSTLKDFKTNIKLQLEPETQM